MADTVPVHDNPHPASDKVLFRIDLANGARLGPGKVQLLQLIGQHGSIRAAGAALGMSYRRAWLLADEINRMFREPSITTRHGGKSGGGAVLTPFGEALLIRAQMMDVKIRSTLAEDLTWLEAMAADRIMPPE
ncbi:winged helix-turn-helix domain-containing protein [Agrobacterium vitis]|uniref:winged helix-turn-helix domain-containing protein n=1 Tax=Agrobacterium vitis TaxID=373 RepID=UPI0008733A0F|nr:LysR family transcriptional regulator [Agrobacterium vitis]MCE6074874.1 LysR family transcriptional regulator [Agrobacterium vitis]MCF1451537.1 LysR family transcriptional regulator [Agrobacterium vitis]MCM2450948.1 LysR family transcriptional regulator [Agrobacterium vitis]MCM2467721.1 LysR family transcriptional regulator [Agrobacterium vitis]MUO68374.1 LysR family transcriptional regulator [Agrobacterium vitis]